MTASIKNIYILSAAIPRILNLRRRPCAGSLFRDSFNDSATAPCLRSINHRKRSALPCRRAYTCGCGSNPPGSGPGLGRTTPVVGTGEPRNGGSVSPPVSRTGGCPFKSSTIFSPVSVSYSRRPLAPEVIFSLPKTISSESRHPCRWRAARSSVHSSSIACRVRAAA